MPKCRSIADALALVLLVVPLGPARLTASAPPPGVTASISVNGRFLAVTQMELGSADPTVSGRIVRTTWQVLEVEPFINRKDRLSSTTRFWSPRWRVTLQQADHSIMTWPKAKDGQIECPYWPMVSDDGRYLVLVGVNFGFAGQEVLHIYREVGAGASLVKSFQISDLWTLAEVESHPNSATDASPQWFAGGSLSFAPDGEHLVYRTQWNDLLSIQLATGLISREQPGQ